MATKRSSSGSGSDLNIGVIPASIVAGIIAWFLGSILYSAMLDSIPRPVVIGIVFTVLYLFILIAVILVSVIQRQFQGNAVTLLISFLAGAPVVFLLAALFQFIYGLDFKPDITGPSSYVFIIDDSGSTADSDPNMLRYQAIEDVLQGADAGTPYMVYSFSDTTEIVREMGPAAAGEQPLQGQILGGTSIKGALQTAIRDYRNGVWDAGGKAPKVVLLTDGYATDIGFFSPIDKVLDEYVEDGISVSTVGLGNADEQLMKQIAEATGGVYVGVSDAKDLSNAMVSAAHSVTTRDLVSSRSMRKLNLLYAVLRVLFITLLGTLIGGLIAFAYGNQDSFVFSTIASAILSLIGGLIMEIFTGVIHFNDTFVWLILWIFLAATLLLKRYVKGIKTVDLTYDSYKGSYY